MMARLLDDVSSRVAPGGTESGKPPQQHVPSRRLSFKTRQASGVARPNYRSTKISLSSTNVAVIASKFNTIVIDDGPQGRAILRKLSSNQRKTGPKEVKIKTKVDGVVKAAVEMFEQQDSEKNLYRPSLKGGNDLRPKLVVVRKSLSKAPIKSEEPQNVGHSSKLDLFSKESAKDSHNMLSQDSNLIKSPEFDIKEIKRKPSLKAKPNLRHVLAAKQEKESSLNQRILKFNETKSRTEDKGEKISLINHKFAKPNFSLNDRIAQFNKNDEDNSLAMKKNNVLSTSLVQDKKQLFGHSEEKENTKNPKNSILINKNMKQTSIIEVTKSESVTNPHQHTNSNLQSIKSQINCDKKQHLIKDKFIVGENKQLKVFQVMPDIIKSAELKDKSNSIKSHDISVNSMKPPLNLDVCRKNDNIVQKPSRESEKKIKDTVVDKSSTRSFVGNEQIKLQSYKKDSFSTIKPAIKQETPNLKEKLPCPATETSDNIQSDKVKCVALDRIKPNSSFLWKPTGGINVIKEVPIYDDRPENQNNNLPILHDMPRNQSNNDGFGNGAADSYKAELQSKLISDTDNDSKSSNSTNLDIANSFILEMTEQIDKRFSNGSLQEGDFDYCSSNSPTVEPKENIVKNTSFLHGKSKILCGSKANLKTNICNDLTLNNKPDLVQLPKETSSNVELVKGIEDDVPPKLPDKGIKPITTVVKNFNRSSHLISSPQLTPKHGLEISDEIWLSNCKKILEIPPPLRKKHKENSLNENVMRTVIEKEVSATDQVNINQDKRFSVSQVELLSKMSEMNLNKWNSLPSEAFTLLSTNRVPEEEDIYTSIKENEKEGSDDQDSYEMVSVTITMR